MRLVCVLFMIYIMNNTLVKAAFAAFTWNCEAISLLCWCCLHNINTVVRICFANAHSQTASQFALEHEMLRISCEMGDDYNRHRAKCEAFCTNFSIFGFCEAKTKMRLMRSLRSKLRICDASSSLLLLASGCASSISLMHNLSCVVISKITTQL